MEMWELIKRLLGGATSNQSFSPGIVAGTYYRELKSAGVAQLPPSDQFSEFADSISLELEAIGLIENAANARNGLAMLNCKRRTAFGNELYESLQERSVVAFFEGMHAEIDSGEIRRLLHQLG